MPEREPQLHLHVLVQLVYLLVGRVLAVLRQAVQVGHGQPLPPVWSCSAGPLCMARLGCSLTSTASMC